MGIRIHGAGPYITCSKTGKRIRVRFSSTEAGIHRSNDSKERTLVDPRTDIAMAPRGPCPALLLPLVLLASCLVLASGQPCVELNKIFQRHHVESPRTTVPNPSSYCNTMMKRRGLYYTAVNTFIHAPPLSINSICLFGTPRPDGLRESRAFIPVTTCRYNPRIRSYRGTYVSRKIVIGCCNRLPVYYKE
ncbi:ribonuclease-like [Mauremys reevesii]|uniref:ribonuclease-like n=1 Tax=Mauremys reevesii TaxID=260615 RepID=UPI00193FAAAD|nr:ribonuclease-like [Mauremys reevesii]